MDNVYVLEEKQLHSMFKIKIFIKTDSYLVENCPRIIANIDKLFTNVYNICDKIMKYGNHKHIKENEFNIELIKLCLSVDNIKIENCYVFNTIFNRIEFFFLKKIHCCLSPV